MAIMKLSLPLIIFFSFLPGLALAVSPTVGTIVPAYGTSNPNETVSFTTTYIDLDGWTNILNASLLINTSTNGANCFYGYYNQNTNRLYLRNDANNRWLGGYTPGSANVIENSYARLNCAATTVSGLGATLTINWSITFKSPFTGTKGLFLYVMDDIKLNSGWVIKGKWTIRNQRPSVGTIIPSSGASAPLNPVSFTTTYVDPDGWLNIQYVYLLINTSTARTNCFYGYYNQNTNKLYLRNDANNRWLGGYTPGSARVIENSYARLNCASTTISGLDTTLTVNWNITFKSTFTGTKNTYLYVRDDANTYAGYTQVGTWTIDDTPPTGSIVINENAEYTNLSLVTLTLSANDPESGVSEMQFSNDNISWSMPEPYNTAEEWVLSLEDGLKTVYSRFRNGAGLWSEVISDDIILDATLPVIQITSPTDNFLTNQNQVDITGNFVESNISSITINDIQAIITDDRFTAEDIVLENEGPNTITAIATDLAGNQNSYETNIVRDTIPPQDPSINPVVTPTAIETQTISGTKSIDTVRITVECSTAAVGEIRYPTDSNWEVDILDMDEGENVINVTAIDITGNQSNPVEVRIIVDTTPPLNPSVMIEEGEYTNNRDINLTLSAEEAVEIAISEDPMFTDLEWEAHEILRSYTLSDGDGIKTVYVKYRDGVGNETDLVSDTIILDTTLPEVQITSPTDNSLTNQNQIDITGSFIETNISLITVNGIVAVISNNSFTAEDIALEIEGPNTITAIATDLAGNQNSHEINIIRDTIPPQDPSINPVETPTAIETQTISGTKSIDTVRLQVECATATVGEIRYPDGTTWESTITGMSEGDNIIRVTAYDEAGNTSNIVEITIILDRMPPEFRNISATPNPFSPNGDGLKDTTTIIAELSEIADWELVIRDNNNNIIRNFSGTGRNISQTWDGLMDDGEPYADGLYFYSITATSVLGNTTTSAVNTIEIDTVPPFAPFEGAIRVEEGEVVHNPNLNLTLTAEGATHMKVYELEGLVIGDWINFTERYPFILSDYEGAKTIIVDFKDLADNITTRWTNVRLDYIPQFIDILIFPNPFSPNNDGINDTTEISITCRYTLMWSFVMKNGLGETVFSASTVNYRNSLGAIWDGTDPDGNPLPDGSYTYYVNGIDEGGNSIQERVGEIGIYTEPLRNAQVSINEGDITNNPNINLTLSCPGASEVIIGEDPVFAGIEWIEFVEETGFSLSSGNGLKTVYARFRDAAGNESETVSDSITLDTTAPLAPTIDPVTTPTDNPQQIIRGMKSEDTTEINIHGVQIENLTYPNQMAWQVEIILQEGFNEINVSAEDSVGNTSQQATAIIYYSWNIERPAIEITSPHDNSVVSSGAVIGRVSDPASTVQVNSIPVVIDGQGLFDINLELQEGENTITATATDTNGDTSTNIIRVIYDTTIPSINIANPRDGATVNRSPIAVRGTIGEPNIDNITVNLISAVIEEGEFTAEGIDLEPGENTITTTATDKAGNTVEANITVTLAQDATIYSLEEVSGSTIMLEEAQLPEVGTPHELKVRLLINNEPANGEIIRFQIIEGDGNLSSPQAQTDNEGEASIYLTLGTDIENVNRIQAWPVNAPEEKVEFIVIGRSAVTRQITKLTDESLTYIPGAEIELIVKVTDSHGNPIRGEGINLEVQSGGGELLQDTATTNDMGESYIGYIVGPVAGVVNNIRASLASDLSVNTTFNIQTIALPEDITVDSIIARVNENDNRIQDIQADVVITSNAPWSDPEIRLHIWQKADKQKVQMTYPREMTMLRPPLQNSPFNVEMQRNIIAYVLDQNIYKIKSKTIGQQGVYPCEIDHVDYEKGVVIRTEYYNIDNNILTLHVVEDLNFIQIAGIWIFQTEAEKMYHGDNLIYTVQKVYTNILLNAGIPDSEFE